MKVFTILLLFSFLLSGCAPPLPFREVEQLQLVQTMGFDASPSGVIVSVSAGSAPEGEAARIAASGKTIDSAVRKLQDFSPREELYFAHVRYAAVGEAAARAGTDGILDYFLRSTQIQLDLPLFIVKDGTAREAVTFSDDPEHDVTAMLASVERDAERMGTAHCFTLLDTAVKTERCGAALCCAVTVQPPSGNVPSAEEGALSVLEAGYAVLKNGALAGWLDRSAALGADLVLGYAGSALYILSDGAGGSVTVELRESETALEPAGDTLYVRADCTAGIVEAETDALTPELLPLLDAELTRAVQRDIEAAIEASKTLDADFLELPEAENVRVEASCTVERSYDIDETL